MTEDPFDRIRRLNPVTDDVAVPPIETIRRHARIELITPVHRRRRLVSGEWAIASLGILLAVAIAGAAILALAHRPNRPAAPTSTAPAGARGLIAELAVLRRPQSASDLDSKQLQAFLRASRLGPLAALRGTPIRSLIRLAATTRYGKVFLVPVSPPNPRTIARLPAHLRALGESELRHGANVASLALVAGGGADCCTTAAGFADRGAGIQAGSSPSTVILVLPDGVEKVTVLLPRQAIRGDRAYKHPLAITVPVHDNVAAFQVNRYTDDVGTQNMIWYGPHGNIIKRIRNPLNLAKVIPPPKPTPATPLSRQAERNPATPNPVSVTPKVGGPNTTFIVSFRALLNKAFYEYLFSGPGGPGCHGKAPSRGGGAIGGGPRDVRGQIISQPFSPQTGASTETSWCPGIFQVKVAAVAGGRTFAPFGTATFTVKP